MTTGYEMADGIWVQRWNDAMDIKRAQCCLQRQRQYDIRLLPSPQETGCAVPHQPEHNVIDLGSITHTRTKTLVAQVKELKWNAHHQAVCFSRRECAYGVTRRRYFGYKFFCVRQLSTGGSPCNVCNIDKAMNYVAAAGLYFVVMSPLIQSNHSETSFTCRFDPISRRRWPRAGSHQVKPEG